ncbi:MAG: hypothetical protein QXS21_03125 [Thermoproteota archaeon]|nr:hypothetical protein [Candidatus Brockarchaeota archaeon]MBO3768713.1 hypothetical protein [Candidatus Brockarchaeota archaeon]MBO3801717.1 hypothetical protein [Candidatus Brockarchaeota archaeon]
MENEEKHKEIKIEEIKDIEELKAVLRTVREEVPGLLKDLVGPLKELMTVTMTEEQAREKAKAIAAFYKELIAAGMKESDAAELVKSQFLSPSEVFRNLLTQVQKQKTEESSKKES